MGSLQIIQHSTGHTYPLTVVDSEMEFLCQGCRTLGNGRRYRCECDSCDFNLHEFCANCPTELFKRFMHDHRLTLVFNPQSAMGLAMKNCNLCGDPVQGLFYGCNDLCDFSVHPLCTQLPEYVKHVKDKAHGLWLQRLSDAASCVVCKNACPPWRYRCGICRLDLHLECVLAPCEEVESTSTPRSYLPFLDAYHYAYGYGGAIGRPPYSADGYGGCPLAASYFGNDHTHGYGATNYIPSPYLNTYAPSCGYMASHLPPHPAPYAPSLPPPHPAPYGYMASHPPPHPAPYGPSHPPPHPAPYAPSHPPAHPAPYAPSHPPAHPAPYAPSHGYMASHPPPPPHPPSYAPSHGYGANIPPTPYGGVSASPYPGSHHHQQQQSSSNSQQVHQGGGGGFGKKMYALIGQLAVGVASNVLFGAISS